MKPPTYHQRLGVLLLLCLAGAVVILVRTFSFQVTDREFWEARARSQAAGWRPVHAPRGRILDADGKALSHGAAAFDLVVRAAPWEAERHVCRNCAFVRYFKPDGARVPCPQCRRPPRTWRFADHRELAFLADKLSMPEAELRKRVELRIDGAKKKLKKELGNLVGVRRARRRRMAWADLGWRGRTVARDISYEAAREVQLHPARYPAFLVETVQSRRMPGGRAFVHLVGRVRRDRIRTQDPEGGGRYVDVERGVRGLERAFDEELSSVTGWVRFLRNPRGGGREMETAARAVGGLDVRLTLRHEDQQRALDVLGGDEGALVVLHAETGAVLAMAASPTYDPDEYVRTLETWRTRKGGPTPLVDRAASSAHIPGSIMKPFTALAALRAGVINGSTKFHCDRYFRTAGGRVIRNALKCAGVHGDVSLHEALVRSCNVYFQTGMQGLLTTRKFKIYYETGRRFGFGRSPGVETSRTRGRFEFGMDTTWYQYIATAIGQGNILVTPVQIARAYAGLATGVLPDVHVVAKAGLTRTPVRRTPLGLDAGHLEAVRSALREVPVRGTARGLGLARFQISCKTGTAQVRGGQRDPRYNSWIAGFAPARAGRPPISFAIVVLNARRHSGEECGPRLAEFLAGFYAETTE